MPGDLHTHSTFSDGSAPADWIPRMAARAGLTSVAVSDHDSVRGVRWACSLPQEENMTVIPAAELSSFDPSTGRRVHILCYWPEAGEVLEEHCRRIARRRSSCYYEVSRELEKIYPQYRTEDAEFFSAASGVLFMSSIMAALCREGIADSIYGAVYHELFGREGRFHTHVEYDTVEQVLETAHRSRAAVVLAHPSVYHSMPLVRELAAAGMIDGIEADHPRNTPEDRAECRELCRRYGLIATGGTDYHGAFTPHPLPVGTCITADDSIARLKETAKRRRG